MLFMTIFKFYEARFCSVFPHESFTTKVNKNFKTCDYASQIRSSKRFQFEFFFFCMSFKMGVDLRVHSDLVILFFLTLSRILWAPVKPISGLECNIMKNGMPGYGRMAQAFQKICKFLAIEEGFWGIFLWIYSSYEYWKVTARYSEVRICCVESKNI